jgi:hypothetical protein
MFIPVAQLMYIAPASYLRARSRLCMRDGSDPSVLGHELDSPLLI